MTNYINSIPTVKPSERNGSSSDFPCDFDATVTCCEISIQLLPDSRMLEAISCAALLQFCSGHQLRPQAPPFPFFLKQSQLRQTKTEYF